MGGEADTIETHQTYRGNLGRSSNTIKKKRCVKFWEYVEHDGNKQKCKFCGKTIKAQSITRMKYHWAGENCRDVLPCTMVKPDVQKDAKADIENRKSRKEATNKKRACDLPTSLPSPGSLTCESPSRRLSSSSAHEASSLQSCANVISTAQQIGDMALTTKWTIQKGLFFTGLSPRLLSSGEFIQLCEAVSAARGVHSHELPPVVMVPEDAIFTELKYEIDDYVKRVRNTWISNGCTISIKELKMPYYLDFSILGAIARCCQGTIFLRYDTIKTGISDEMRMSKMRDFISSIIEEVGLDNIAQILVPHDFILDNNNPIDIQSLLSIDLAHHLALTHGSLSSTDRFPSFFFWEYAIFISDIYKNCLESHHMKQDCETVAVFHEGNDNKIMKVMAVVERKQEIVNLIDKTILDADSVTRLPFWNNNENYAHVCEQIKRMFWVAKENPYFSYPELNFLFELEKKRISNIIFNILKGNDIVPSSTFWKSAEAYDRLYKHISKMLMQIGNFTYACYFDALKEANTIIRKEDFFIKDYTKIINKLDYLLPQAKHGQFVAHYLCHWSQCMKLDDCDVKTAESEILRTMESNGVLRRSLGIELTAYREKDITHFMEEAWSLEELQTPSIAWWEKWGKAVPHLKKIALKMLCRFCSCERFWRIIDDIYGHMSKKYEGQKLREWIYLRLNNHFMQSSVKGREEGSFSVSAKMAYELSEWNPRGFRTYFLNDVYQW